MAHGTRIRLSSPIAEASRTPRARSSANSVMHFKTGAKSWTAAGGCAKRELLHSLCELSNRLLEPARDAGQALVVEPVGGVRGLMIVGVG